MMLKNLGILLNFFLFMLQNLLLMLCNQESLHSTIEIILLLPVSYINMHIFKIFESERKMHMKKIGSAVGRVLDSRLRVRASSASLRCVLEQDTLILA